jgi:ankyrin repeat protein
MMTTPLHQAASDGDVETIKTLLAMGANIEQHDYEYDTPLAAAMHADHIDAMEALIEGGANVDGTCVEDYTPLILAILDENDCMVEFLLTKGANIHYKAPNCGMTALHFTAYYDNLTAAQILLHHGADYTMEDDLGRTPLKLARLSDSHYVEGLLRKASKKN